MKTEGGSRWTRHTSGKVTGVKGQQDTGGLPSHYKRGRGHLIGWYDVVLTPSASPGSVIFAFLGIRVL